MLVGSDGSGVVKVEPAKKNCPCQNVCWQLLYCLEMFGQARQL